MGEILVNEFRKSRRSWKRILLVTAVALGVYLFLAWSGNFRGYTGTNFQYVLGEGRKDLAALKGQKHGVVDEAFMREAEKAYRAYVDRYRSSDEEIKEELKKYGDSCRVEDVLYDHDYTYLVFSSETLERHPEIEILEEETANAIIYGKDPEKYMLGQELISCYSPELQADYKKCIAENQRGKKVVAGYFLGWDMAISIMQFLPALLGTVVVVSLFGIFAGERRCQTTSLLLTAKYGKNRLLRAKFFLSWALTTVQWLLFQLAGIGISAATLGLEGMDCTFFSPLHPSAYGFSCIQYYLVQLLFSYLGTIFFMLCVCLISCLLNDRLALTCGLIGTYATSVVDQAFWNAEPAYSAMEKLRAIFPTQLMGAYHIFPYYQGYSFGGLVLRLPEMAGVVLVAGIALCLWGVAVAWRGMA